ncbi:heme-binding domain-containing protein [Nitrosophilus alvini]|uniref:heme-binding domain-containing protein n=1 Tax=Nitrosophilus alvini TaxID=2714855 RepID=UPI00190D30D6|nr:heme-binding domain-containing protein [Nitrosophilus alvini]
MKKRFAAIVLIILIAIQFVPYGKDHKNPPVVSEPQWDSPKTREYFFRACKDCHSNETEWPWYSNIAPMSWLIQRDVEEGREHFNISEWGVKRENDGEEAAEEVREGEMPPWFYLIAHPEARLSKEEKKKFITGLIKTFGDKKRDDDHHDED